MANSVFEIKGLDQLKNDLEHLPDWTQEIFTSAMQEAVHVVEAAVKSRTPVARGNLAGSINTRVLTQPEWVEGVIGTNVPYAPWMEEGTSPHWAPIGALMQWVHDKKIAGTYSIRTHQRLGGKNAQAQQDMALAKAVQVKIAKYGTKGAHMFRDGLAESEEMVQEIFDRAVDDVLKKFVGTP